MLFGGSYVARVRSWLICFQFFPPSTVFQSTLLAKNSDVLSTSENTTGIVRTRRKFPGAPADAAAAANRTDAGGLPGPAIEARHGSAAVDDVGVERIRSDVAVLVDADRQPVAHRRSRHSCRGWRCRPTRSPAGRCRRDTETRCRRPRDRAAAVGWLYQLLHVSPPFSEIDRALIGREHDDVGVVGIDPAVLVVLAARCSLEWRPGLAAVGGLPRDGAGDDERCPAPSDAESGPEDRRRRFGSPGRLSLVICTQFSPASSLR